MNLFKLEFVDEKYLREEPAEHDLLRVYTGRNISTLEADRLLQRVTDHKWFVSESLRRDVGFHVAAIDYVENFYEPQRDALRMGFDWRGAASRVGDVFRKYFELRGGQFPM